MALTYTEIQEAKSIRIWIFFTVLLLFYFVIAAVLGNVTKAFFVLNSEAAGKVTPFLTGRELLYILFFAFGAAVIHAAYSVSNALPLITRNLGAHNADLSDKYHERFKKIVDEVNVATGSKYKITSIVIPTVAMNAFAISDRHRNAVIGVTEGLLSKLNRQQLEAVVAHECGHIVSGDSFQTTVGCALFGIYAAMLAALGKVFKGGRVRSSGKGSGGIILFLLLVYAILSVMQFFYNLIRLFISRDRELRADAVAVKLTRDPISLGGALYSISRGWRGMGYIDRNLESLFIINPAREEIDEAEGLFANLLSTHPPIGKRISILANMAHVDVKDIENSVISQEKLKEHARFQLPGGAGRETSASAFNCPRCKRHLMDEEYEGALAQRCLSCGGILVEKGRLPRIMIRREKGFDERVQKIAELTQRDGLTRLRDKTRVPDRSYLKCPKCGIDMIKGFYTMAYLVEVDKCDFCGLVWFDTDELEILQYLIENKKSS
ncbi:MAG: M48 family metalloprotease [Candidatus Omnitrophica bacterium]|nr:M48 family metalloprotease [Candidatus Omnitrophota bacterium]MBU4488150.1 M48 family metalloprotease [Candidatus Omnitrophota bacterium]MCG2704537.1 zinc metalloprotease HtpX [Candidatus Omnitrophota bacterium]